MLLYGVCYGMPTGIHATFIGECFPTHLRSTGVGFTSVSYTHLDVYKRQELLAASAKELEKAGIALITVNGGGGLTRLEGMSCLLYTSRSSPEATEATVTPASSTRRILWPRTV